MIWWLFMVGWVIGFHCTFYEALKSHHRGKIDVNATVKSFFVCLFGWPLEVWADLIDKAAKYSVEKEKTGKDGA